VQLKMDESRILDRNNYSVKTIENFEIVSAYYIDIFYNHLYTEAKKLHATGTVSSVTEGYKHTLNAFLKSMSNPKLYKKSVAGIHRYYMSIGFGTISFSKCIDRLVQDFVPNDYFTSLSFQRKMSVLHMVLSQSIKSLIRKIVDSHMIKIIDFHKEKDNARVLQDEFIDCLILEREGMFQRFIASQTKTNKNETVNRLLAERMQAEIKKLVKEKYEQKKQIIILKKAYIQKKESENRQSELISDLQQKIKSLEARPVPRPAIVQQHGMQQHGIMDQKKDFSQIVPSAVSSLVSDATTPDESSYINDDPLPIEQSVSRQSILQGLVESTQEEVPAAGSSLMEIDSSGSEQAEPAFVEINAGNIGDVLRGDSDYIQNLRDSDRFKMDEGTSLSDFS
jgi:hypothetical protein